MTRTAQISVKTTRQGLVEITGLVAKAVHGLVVTGCLGSADRDGLCTIFLRHTSASLTIQENADPSAKRDLEEWLNRLVIENDSIYTHTAEGPDDMPSHIKAALTSSSLSVPIVDGRLTLGTWQGLFLWEHRRPGLQGKRRSLVVHVG